MVIVDLQIVGIMQNTLYKLVCRLNRLKSVKRNGILHPGIMGIKGDYIIHSHGCKLLQSHGAVQRLSGTSSVLSALIQEWHDDGDPVSLAFDSCYDTLQITEVVIRRHMVLIAAYRIGEAVICNIKHNIYVEPSDGLLYESLCLAGTKPGHITVHYKGLAAVSGWNHMKVLVIISLFSPFDQKFINLLADPFHTVHGNYSKWCYGFSGCQCFIITRHNNTPSFCLDYPIFFFILISSPKRWMKR